MTGITIPDSVTSIADYSFNQCANLVRVTIPESVTYIGNYAFNYCTSLTNVTLPGKVTRIRNAAFRNCTSLTSVNIPNGVTNIENFAFESCSGLTNVILPDYLVSIGDSAFSACAGLTNLTLPVCVTNIGNSAFSDCTGLVKFNIPANVTRIGNYAFNSCRGLTNMTIPNGVSQIGDYTFNSCVSLQSVTIPCNVTSIGSIAFNNCQSLTNAYFQGNAPTTFGTDVFYGAASGFTIYYPSIAAGWSTPTWNGYSALTYAMPYGAIQVFLMPVDVENAGAQWQVDGGAWQNSGDIVSKLTTGSHYIAFSAVNGWTAPAKQDILINARAVTVITNTYTHTDFTYSVSGINVTITGYFGAGGDVTIPSFIPGVGTVTAIGNSVFNWCDTLTSVTIPDSVTSIGNNAFNQCTNLTRVSIPNSVTHIGSYAFNYCINLTNLIIPGNVTYIGMDAFRNCESLTSVGIPNGVTNIEESAFSGCSGLTNVTFPDYLVNIGDAAFNSCVRLTHVTIPNGVTNIGSSAFSSCTGLTNLNIPSNVTSIGSYAFESCSSLRSIALPDSLTSMGDWVFSSCISLSNVTIPRSVTRIGSNAFRTCKSLRNVYFQGDVASSFGSQVFDGTASDFTIYYLSTATGWSTPIWNGYPALPYDLNTAPQFAELAEPLIIVNPGATILVTNIATDADVPVQTLTFTMLTGPSDASVDSSSGLFMWRPTIAQAGTKNPVSIVVTDSGIPALSATQSFTVTVLSATAPKVDAFRVVSGVPTLTISGMVGPDYVIQVSTNLVDWQAAATNASPATIPFQWTDTTVPSPIKFYRVRLTP